MLPWESVTEVTVEAPPFTPIRIRLPLETLLANVAGTLVAVIAVVAPVVDCITDK